MTIDELEQAFSDLVSSFSLVSAEEIPDIDLYMDQVTTFMEQKLSPCTRDPENDKRRSTGRTTCCFCSLSSI